MNGSACKSISKMITKRKSMLKTLLQPLGRIPLDNSNEVLKVNGVTYVEDIDKAKAFAKTSKSFSKIPVKKKTEY